MSIQVGPPTLKISNATLQACQVFGNDYLICICIQFYVISATLSLTVSECLRKSPQLKAS